MQNVQMDPQFKPKVIEAALSEFWERENFFKAVVDPSKKPFCIVLPPPNANGNLHVGHAAFVYEDILIRYKKMMGYSTFWVLGLDHAGIETQYVFEKQLQKQGKSRFDFERDVLYQMIWDFVEQSKGTIKAQMKRLGFGLDWSKEQYTLAPKIVEMVYETFEKLYADGLVYRDKRLVNFCTKDGTSFSDLEVEDKETEGVLYSIAYPLVEGEEIVVATTRPETLFGDVAVMVHPEDKRYKKYIGSQAHLPLTNRTVPIIADEYVDPKFGTGAVKVTPSHDFNDFEVGKRHNLERVRVIGEDGRMINTGVVDGMRVKKAREEVVRMLTEANLLRGQQEHAMTIKTCYKCGTTLEPLEKDQWFIKIRPLADKAVEVVNKKEVKVYPKKFTKDLIRILNTFIDWNISRQNVWGIRIPAYYCETKREWFVSKTTPTKCTLCGICSFPQDTDTFDTWFSSSQWPFVTLKNIDQKYYDYFYPTSVMETGYDILRAWVSRMLMVGYYATGKVPFQHVLLHGMVRDGKGQKMSKSKGNVIDPLLMVEKYGADALRAGIVFGTTAGGDLVLSEEKILGMRNFTNKIWNLGRFLSMYKSEAKNEEKNEHVIMRCDELRKEYADLKKEVIKSLDQYTFSLALEALHQFLWHRFADYYIEELKESLRDGNMYAYETLEEVYFGCIQLLHPFMPFITEAVWQQFKGVDSSLLKTRL